MPNGYLERKAACMDPDEEPRHRILIIDGVPLHKARHSIDTPTLIIARDDEGWIVVKDRYGFFTGDRQSVTVEIEDNTKENV